MSEVKMFLCKLFRDEEGASALEYALLAAMVAVIIAAFVPTIGAKVSAIFTSIQNAL